MTATEEQEMHVLARHLEELTRGVGWEASRYWAIGHTMEQLATYKHLTCGSVTTMSVSLAETYARDPAFYSGTFCATCRSHFPLQEFVWDGTTEQLG